MRSLVPLEGTLRSLTILKRTVNGQPGLIAQHDGVTVSVYAFEVAGDRIKHIWAIRNPDKLRPWTLGPQHVLRSSKGPLGPAPKGNGRGWLDVPPTVDAAGDASRRSQIREVAPRRVMPVPTSRTRTAVMMAV